MRRILLVTAVVTAMVVPASAVQADPPQDVEFVVETELPDFGPTFGPFTASGAAVDDGIVCPSGDTIDVFGRASGFQSGRGVNFQVVKLFTCDTQPFGEFLVKLQVRFDARGGSFSWTIVGGTGAYADLHGTGSGVGLPCVPERFDCVLDVYDGGLHIDP